MISCAARKTSLHMKWGRGAVLCGSTRNVWPPAAAWVLQGSMHKGIAYSLTKLLPIPSAVVRTIATHMVLCLSLHCLCVLRCLLACMGSRSDQSISLLLVFLEPLDGCLVAQSLGQQSVQLHHPSISSLRKRMDARLPSHEHPQWTESLWRPSPSLP